MKNSGVSRFLFDLNDIRATNKFGPDRAFFLWRHAALPTDFLQIDSHVGFWVLQQPLLPDGFPKPC